MRERLPYTRARLDILLIESSDIVTSSTLSNDPLGNIDDGGWT